MNLLSLLSALFVTQAALAITPVTPVCGIAKTFLVAPRGVDTMGKGLELESAVPKTAGDRLSIFESLSAVAKTLPASQSPAEAKSLIAKRLADLAAFAKFDLTPRLNQIATADQLAADFMGNPPDATALAILIRATNVSSARPSLEATLKTMASGKKVSAQAESDMETDLRDFQRFAVIHEVLTRYRARLEALPEYNPPQD